MGRWLLMLLVSGSLSIGIVITQEPAMREQQRPGTHGQTGTGRPAAPPTSLRGCLKQLGGNWVLAADTGQTVSLVGNSSMLRPHDGRQIEVQGTLAKDGSFRVLSVTRISDSCTSQRAFSSPLDHTGQTGRTLKVSFRFPGGLAIPPRPEVASKIRAAALLCREGRSTR